MFSYPTLKSCSPHVKLQCITPNEGRIIHRFFDTSPISPSGRYMALCRIPYEDHNAIAGDTAEIVLCDLQTGEERVLYHTHGWETQVGANVQWGATDETLVFNDIIPGEWKPFMVRMQPFTGKCVRMGCGVFMLSPDGKQALTHNLNCSRLTQYGYGVTVPDAFLPHNGLYPADDGFYLTDLDTGECRMAVSLAELLDATFDKAKLAEFENGEFYGFQCKWNRQQTRIMLIVRCLFPETGKKRQMVFTAKPDGSDIHLALPWEVWARGGHHVNWHPDGEHITMNLRIDHEAMRFVSFSYDGNDLHKLCPNLIGSGHPSIHIDGRYLITDAYDHEPFYRQDGTVPIRLVDLQTEKETELARIHTFCPFGCRDLRLDPHPAWDLTFTRIVFNGFEDGSRRVFVLDDWNKIL